MFTLLNEFVLQPIETKFAELSFFSPVVFTLGSLFVAFITLNYPVFLFSVASGEALLLQNVLKGVSNYLITADSIKPKPDSAKCRSTYEGSTPTKFKYLLDNGIGATFPNSALYFLAFATTYCFQAMALFSTEVYERGASVSTRPYLGLISSCLCVLLFSIYTLVYGCDSPLGIIFSVFAGALIGFVLCYQNYFLFGKAGVDMLFIPPLVSRSGMDYICVSTN